MIDHLKIVLAAALLACGCGGGSASRDAGGQDRFATCRGRLPPPVAAQGWRHTSTSILVTPAGPANHSAQDVLTEPAVPATLSAKFAYGVISRDLEDEDVRLFLDDCDGWRDLGVHATSSDGRIVVPVPWLPHRLCLWKCRHGHQCLPWRRNFSVGRLDHWKQRRRAGDTRGRRHVGTARRRSAGPARRRAAIQSVKKGDPMW